MPHLRGWKHGRHVFVLSVHSFRCLFVIRIYEGAIMSTACDNHVGFIEMNR